jgi:hypothetical protein
VTARAIAAKLMQRLDALAPVEAPLRELIDDVAARLRARLEPAAKRVDAQPADGVWAPLAAAIDRAASGNAARPAAQELMEIELAAGLMETWARLAELETAKAMQA